jgi:hypothetical protein
MAGNPLMLMGIIFGVVALMVLIGWIILKWLERGIEDRIEETYE